MTLGRVVSKGCQVRFSRVPAHVGVIGNEAVDRVAKKALRKEVVTLGVKWSKGEAKSIIWAKMERWQVQWDEELKGRHLYRIQRKSWHGPLKSSSIHPRVQGNFFTHWARKRISITGRANRAIRMEIQRQDKDTVLQR
ncbi:hypothetical protein DPEC_G00044590 [Dallia pectoralis]|uniref:Uncharacterized protein n=1 Tax=Dallia pectoralis TaxID=75939 RepID=A0ACC2H9H1_DALPE|nr:hypothetical protein DPEC_G00044590 [Dallia pectoralis]